MSDFASDCIKTARKEHVCFCCGGKIKKNEKYVYVSGKLEGDMFTTKMHQRCSKMLQVLDSLYYIDSGCFNEGEFNDAISEYCHEHICENCEKWDDDSCMCVDDNIPSVTCLERVWNYMLTSKLV